MDHELDIRLKNIEKMTVLAAKRMLSVKDVSLLTGFAESYIRKLVQESRLPHYRPMGKMIFFDREEIDSFLRSNRVPSAWELISENSSICQTSDGVCREVHAFSKTNQTNHI